MTSAQIFVVIAAAFLANLPFILQRHFLGIPLRPSRLVHQGAKLLYVRLLELITSYLLVGTLARVLEKQAHGDAFKQGWEFYAITFSFFVVLAYPGFVYRYLWLSRKNHAG